MTTSNMARLLVFVLTHPAKLDCLYPESLMQYIYIYCSDSKTQPLNRQSVDLGIKLPPLLSQAALNISSFLCSSLHYPLYY